MAKKDIGANAQDFGGTTAKKYKKYKPNRLGMRFPLTQLIRLIMLIVLESEMLMVIISKACGNPLSHCQIQTHKHTNGLVLVGLSVVVRATKTMFRTPRRPHVSCLMDCCMILESFFTLKELEPHSTTQQPSNSNY